MKQGAINFRSFMTYFLRQSCYVDESVSSYVYAIIAIFHIIYVFVLHFAMCTVFTLYFPQWLV